MKFPKSQFQDNVVGEFLGVELSRLFRTLLLSSSIQFKDGGTHNFLFRVPFY